MSVDTFEFDVDFIERELIQVTLQTLDIAPGTVGAENLADLNDVTLSSLQNQQYLRYNASTGKWENVTLDVIIGENSIFNESPTKLTTTQFQTVNNFITGSLRVFLNGIKEKNITVDSTNTFSLPIDVNLDDEIEVNYIRA